MLFQIQRYQSVIALIIYLSRQESKYRIYIYIVMTFWGYVMTFYGLSI